MMSDQNSQSPVDGLFIQKAELEQLQAIIEEVPTKYGVRLLQFFQAVGQKRAIEQQQAVENAKIKKGDSKEEKSKN